MKTRFSIHHLPSLKALATASLILSSFFPSFAQDENQAMPKAQEWSYAALEKIPEKNRAMRNPLESDSHACAAGGKLYQQHCAECHGLKAEGGKRGANLLVKEVQQATPGALFWILTNGVVRHGMPVWSKLPEPERWQLVTFLRSLLPSTIPPAPVLK